jgi:hypothetical protein
MPGLKQHLEHGTRIENIEDNKEKLKKQENSPLDNSRSNNYSKEILFSN